MYAAPGSWDDVAIWTGSLLAHRSGKWLTAYTGISREHGVAIERIGLAWSDDLVSWRKDPNNPVLESDPRWYEQPGESSWQHGWRDPFLFATDDRYGMLISARVRSAADPYLAGSVAFATSADGSTWEAQPPIVGTTGLLAQIEVPHLVATHNGHHLVFCTNTDARWPRDVAGATRLIGTGAFFGESPAGPYVGAPHLFDADESGSRYGGRVISHGNDLLYMAFVDGGDHNFSGTITDPIPIHVNPSTNTLTLTP